MRVVLSQHAVKFLEYQLSVGRQAANPGWGIFIPFVFFAFYSPSRTPASECLTRIDISQRTTPLTIRDPSHSAPGEITNQTFNTRPPQGAFFYLIP